MFGDFFSPVGTIYIVAVVVDDATVVVDIARVVDTKHARRFSPVGIADIAITVIVDVTGRDD